MNEVIINPKPNSIKRRPPALGPAMARITARNMGWEVDSFWINPGKPKSSTFTGRLAQKYGQAAVNNAIRQSQILQDTGAKIKTNSFTALTELWSENPQKAQAYLDQLKSHLTP